MNTKYKGTPTIINGDSVIKFTNTQAIKNLGWMDRPSLAAWYQEDPTKNHLGMFELFTNHTETRVPLMKDLFDKKAVIEVNGMEYGFTYDLPVYKPQGTYTMADTSLDTPYPGIDESYFTIGLSKAYQPNDVLTYDMQYGEQIEVSSDHTVDQEGDFYVHTVRIVGNDKAAFYPMEKLKKGIQYFKVTNNIGENDTQFSNLESPGTQGTLTCEFVLGNHRGVETGYTMYADKKNFSGASIHSKDHWNYFVNEQKRICDDLGRELDMVMVGNINKSTGKMIDSSARLGSTLEMLVILENIKMEANQIIFQKGGMMKSGNGVKRLNEGVWHQIRRGRKIQYSRPGGITREHIRQASAYIFQGRTDLLPMQRKIKFKAGMEAYMNMMVIFREEFNMQLAGLSVLMGTDRQLPSNPVSGTLDALKLAPVIISQVPIPDIGVIEVEYDPSLNYQLQSERFSRGQYGQGHSKDAYSLVIWDASSSEYSNARTNLPSGTTLIHGGTSSNNVYYVKPEGESMWWGYEQGRWSPNKTSDIVSSSKHMKREFWVHSTSAGWVKDISKFLIIELKR